MRFGILGWGKIARQALAPAIAEAGHTVVAVGSREPGAAVVPEMPEVVWSDYQAVLDNPVVDAVYIALPNHLHVPWTLRALAAGKHVLCEKPMALTLAEVDAVQAAALASGRLMREAFMVGHHPQWHWLREQPLGPLRSMQVAFAYDNRDANNIRNRVEWGGGALWDIGCYAVFAGQWLMGREPDACQLQVSLHPAWGTDVHAHGSLTWGDDAVLQFQVSTQAARQQAMRVVGEHGWAELAVPFNPPQETPVRRALNGGLSTGAETLVLPPVNQYAEMVKAFALAAEQDVKTDLADSRAVARTLVRLRVSAGL